MYLFRCLVLVACCSLSDVLGSVFEAVVVINVFCKLQVPLIAIANTVLVILVFLVSFCATRFTYVSQHCILYQQP